jgi:hypothetical protein
MRGMRDRLLRLLLAWLALYHLTVGALSLLAPASALDLGARLYGVGPERTPALLALMRPLGAYAVTIGFLAAAAARDPARHRIAVDALALLFLLRLAHRLLAPAALAEGLAISAAQNYFNSALLAVQLAGLVVLRPR